METNTEIKEITEIKTIDENYDNLKAVIIALTQDYEKFKSKKIKAAGQRVRNGLLNTKKLCDTLRKQVLADIKNLPIKHRSKSSSDEEDEVKSEDGEVVIQLLSEDEVKSEESPVEEKEEKEDKPKKKRIRKANKKK